MRRKLIDAGRTVRVLVIEDAEIWRKFILTLIQESPAYEVAAIAENGLDGVQKAKKLQPEIVLVDVGLPRLNGIEAARQIRKACPQIRIVFLTENTDPAVVTAAFEVGADGYVVKSDAHRELLLSLKLVQREKQFLSRRVRKIAYASEKEYA